MADGNVKLFFEEITGQAPDDAKRPEQGAGRPAAEAEAEQLQTKATLVFRWSPLMAAGELPAARGGHTVTRVPETGRLVLFGGASRAGGVPGGVYEAELDAVAARLRWTRRGEAGQPAPPARSGHSAVAVPGGRVVVYGGLAEGTGEFLGDAWELDTAAWAWRRLETSGEAPRRNGHSAVLVGGRTMVVIGGSDVRPQADVHALNLETGAWRRLQTEGDAGAPREMHAAAVLPACPQTGRVTVVVTGGRTAEGLAGAVRCLDIPAAVDAEDGAAARWRAAGEGPELCGHAAVPVGNCVALFGGTDLASFSRSVVFGTRGLAAPGSGCSADDWRDVDPAAAAPPPAKKGKAKRKSAAEPPPARFAHTLTPLETGAAKGHFSYLLFGGSHPERELADAYELRVQPGMIAE